MGSTGGAEGIFGPTSLLLTRSFPPCWWGCCSLPWGVTPTQRHQHPPDLLTNVEGVGGLLVAQLQVEDICRLRVMPEPQGHSEDDATGQLGRKQREAGVTHRGGPGAAVLRLAFRLSTNSYLLLSRTTTSFLTIVPTSATCFVPHTTSQAIFPAL